MPEVTNQCNVCVSSQTRKYWFFNEFETKVSVCDKEIAFLLVSYRLKLIINPYKR